MTYRVQLLFQKDKDPLIAANYYAVVDAHGPMRKQSLTKLWTFMDQFFEEGKTAEGCKRSFITIAAYPEGRGQLTYRTTLQDEESEADWMEWCRLLDKLTEWTELRRALIVEARVVATTPPPLKEAPTPRASQRPAASQQRPPRQTATQRQVDRIEATEEELEQEGNFATRLTMRWQCKLGSCRNNPKKKGHSEEAQGLCWVNGRDTPENHFPLYGACLQSWAAAIRDGKATADSPPTRIGVKLALLKMQGRTRHGDLIPSKATKNQSQQSPVVINNYLTSSSLKTAGAKRPRSSSSEGTCLMSSQQAPEDHWTEFFQYCRPKQAWKRDLDNLTMMEAEIKDAGYTIEAVQGLKEEQWRALGLKVGHLQRIQHELKRWKLARRLSREVPPPPSPRRQQACAAAARAALNQIDEGVGGEVGGDTVVLDNTQEQAESDFSDGLFVN